MNLEVLARPNIFLLIMGVSKKNLAGIGAEQIIFFLSEQVMSLFCVQ